MQRVSSLLPLWDRSKSSDANNANHASGTAASASTPSLTALHNRSSTGSTITTSTASNTNASSNRFSNTSSKRGARSLFGWTDRIGSSKSLTVSPSIANASRPPRPATPKGIEAYWPTSLDRECEKAALILKSFCTDGFLDEDAADSTPTTPKSRTSRTSLASPRFPPRRPADALPGSPTTTSAPTKKKIPPRIIQEAVGLAIFSCVRSGLWMSGSGGSGILIARKADNTWSPPSGIMLHTATVAFVHGIDIYDCVLVINSFAALEMFTRSRVTLGTDVPLAVGPLVDMGLLENDVRLDRNMADTVLTYLKAHGRYSPAQLHGSLVTERSNENDIFYNNNDGTTIGTYPIEIQEILAGRVRRSIPEIVPLFEAIKAAEGRIDFDTTIMARLSEMTAPGDADIAVTPDLLSPASPTHTTFGIPDAADPDPFGIIALEMAGMEIRQANTKPRPASRFSYTNASPTSPFSDSRFSHRSNDVTPDFGNRASMMSTHTQATSTTDAYAQTAGTPDTSLSPTHSDDGKDAQECSASHTASSPIPALSVQTPLAKGAAGISDAPPAIPPRNRVSRTSKIGAVAAEEKRKTTFLTVGPALEAGKQVSGADETVAPARAVDDERDEDADDEDEETDGLAGEAGDDLDDVDDEDDLEDDDDDDDDDDDLLDDDEEPVIIEVAATSARPVRVAPAKFANVVGQAMTVKGALVTIPKRIPPPLPMRSSARTSRASKSDFGGSVSALASPMRNSFQGAKTGDSNPESLVAEVTKAFSHANASDGASKAATQDVTKRGSFTPQAREPTTVSSIDESDKEPKTPRPDVALKFNNHNGHAAPNKATEDLALSDGDLDAATVALP